MEEPSLYCSMDVTFQPLHTYRVRAFDPTATPEEEAALELHQNVSFHKLGIAHFNGNTQVFVDHREVAQTLTHR